MVITLTNLPAEIEEALQRKAEAEGKSVDRVTVDILARGLDLERHTASGPECSTDNAQREFAERAKAAAMELNQALSPIGQDGLSDKASAALEEQRERATLKPGTQRDLSFIVGTWIEDPEFDRILEEQRRIDPELWQ